MAHSDEKTGGFSCLSHSLTCLIYHWKYDCSDGGGEEGYQLAIGISTTLYIYIYNSIYIYIYLYIMYLYIYIYVIYIYIYIYIYYYIYINISEPTFITTLIRAV